MIPAVKWGALVGVGSYVILIIGLTLLSSILFGTSPADFSHPGPLTLACLGIFGILFAFSAAGYFTGRETRRVAWGAISAIIALAIYYVLSLIYTPGRSTSLDSSSTGTSGQLSAAAQVLSAIAAAAVVLLIAAAMGWLGARPAIQQARKRMERLATARAEDIVPAPDTSSNG